MDRKKITHCFVITTIFGMLLGAKAEKFLYDPVISAEQQEEGYVIEDIGPYRPDSDMFIKGVAGKSGDLGFGLCVKSTEVQGVLAVGLSFSNLSGAGNAGLPGSSAVRVLNAASEPCEEMSAEDILQALEKEKKEEEQKDLESQSYGLFNPVVRDNYYNRLKKEVNLMVSRRYEPKELVPGDAYGGDIYYGVSPDDKVTVTVNLNGKEHSFLFEKKVPGKEKRQKSDGSGEKASGAEIGQGKDKKEIRQSIRERRKEEPRW